MAARLLKASQKEDSKPNGVARPSSGECVCKALSSSGWWAGLPCSDGIQELCVLP